MHDQNTHEELDLSQLLRDLLDPDLDTLDLCDIHGLSVARLEAVLTSPEFRNALTALERIETLRIQAIEARARRSALGTLERIAASTPDEPLDPARTLALREQQRKSADRLLRDTATSRKTPLRKNHTDTPRPSHAERRSLPAPPGMPHPPRTRTARTLSPTLHPDRGRKGRPRRFRPPKGNTQDPPALQ